MHAWVNKKYRSFYTLLEQDCIDLQVTGDKGQTILGLAVNAVEKKYGTDFDHRKISKSKVVRVIAYLIKERKQLISDQLIWMQEGKKEKLQSFLHAHIGGYYEYYMRTFARELEDEV
jgi:hypothetical protein